MEHVGIRQIIVRRKAERTMSKKMAEVRVARPSKEMRAAAPPAKEVRASVRPPKDGGPAARPSKGSRVLSGIPMLAISRETFQRERFDPHTAFLLTFVDGTLSVETILDVCSMPREEALMIFGELAARGIIVFAPKMPRASQRPKARTTGRPSARTSSRPGQRPSKRPPR